MLVLFYACILFCLFAYYFLAMEEGVETKHRRTNDTLSQVEQPSLAHPDRADSIPLETAEPAETTASASPASQAPRRTLPLTPSDVPPFASPATVATEQALVATDLHSRLPLAPAALPSLGARWWRVLRPATFWLSLVPVILGTATAWLEPASKGSDVFHPIRLFALALVVLALHGGANLLNEYYDMLRGTDGEHALGSSRIIQRGLLPSEVVRRAGLLLLAIGALALLILTLALHAWGVLLLGSAALLLAYLYSATRYALAYFPLSELIIGFVMGPAILISSVQIQGAHAGKLAIPFALAVGSFAAAAMLANNLRDLETDRAANKRTLATYLGAQMARTLYLALVLLPYLLIALVAFPPLMPHGIVLVLLTLPGLFVVITGILRAETPAATHMVVGQTLRLHLRFSLWLLVGYLLSIGALRLLSII
jgi:1,4-dihydroxy-2-naphthoate octaprenyltransferase